MAGKAALVTGAASGIGRATALLFAREGARLVASDVDRAGLESLRQAVEAQGGAQGSAPGGAPGGLPGAALRCVVGDVSSTQDARAMVQDCVDGFGRIDILVANAGIIPELDLLQSTAEDFDHVMAVDGRGMFLCCKFAAEAMLRQDTNGAAADKRGGAIVCLSSISGEAGQPSQAVYGPAKFVASGITKHLAVELAGRGIRVNAVAPGTIATPAVERMSVEYIAAVKAMHPMRRIGRPDEVAQAILFLASDEASFITGAVLPVDGGYLAQ